MKPAIDIEPRLEEKDTRIKVGYYDACGVLFSGTLTKVVRGFAEEVFGEVFGISIRKMMPAFIDVKPDKLQDGVHDVSVYEHDCQLHIWRDCEEVRGHIVLTNSEIDNAGANIRFQRALMRPRRVRRRG